MSFALGGLANHVYGGGIPQNWSDLVHLELRHQIDGAFLQKPSRERREAMMRRTVLIAWVAAAAVTTLNPSLAQQPPAPPYKVTPLVSAPLTADPSRETVVVRVDWPANVSTPVAHSPWG
jgi:hypothetical protein